MKFKVIGTIIVIVVVLLSILIGTALRNDSGAGSTEQAIDFQP